MGTVCAAKKHCNMAKNAAAAAQPDATGGSGRSIPTIAALFEPKRGGRCCRGHTLDVKRVKTRTPNLTPFDAVFEFQSAPQRSDIAARGPNHWPTRVVIVYRYTVSILCVD